MTLTPHEIKRYGRQLLVPQFGIEGQRKLRAASALIVGTGGLGAPAAMYLAAAGIGHLGLADHDTVEVSNLHRQVLHTEDAAGMAKTASARRQLERLNSLVRITEHPTLVDASTALALLAPYDVILDCSDNAATRYLLNDACVLLNKPLVSASALRTEGHLTVYHHLGGPCYRCLFPVPPPAATVTNCADGGVMGPVTGTLGAMQAMEAIKVVVGASVDEVLVARMAVLDLWAATSRVVRLRGRQKGCAVCGDAPTVTELVDYVLMCGSGPMDKTPSISILPESQRLSPVQFKARLDDSSVLLLDVREPVQFNIAHLPGSINVPYRSLATQIDHVRSLVDKHSLVLVVCRRGNDSQRAVRDLRDTYGVKGCVDMVGGLDAWAASVDDTFPMY
ncbi:putative molybdenum/thiazole biosynthesis cofactor [Blastocladiella britannica]|nr:putative molybdenum/thiazole biosynthesis cofactor [Blastocladiella britannica]